MVDGSMVWTVGQSFNALAEHSHSGITKTMEPQVVADKVAAYGGIWGRSQAIW